MTTTPAPQPLDPRAAQILADVWGRQASILTREGAAYLQAQSGEATLPACLRLAYGEAAVDAWIAAGQPAFQLFRAWYRDFLAKITP